MDSPTLNPKRGGRREGAGRPSEGKKNYTLTLTEDTVKAAREKTDNLSRLLDGLLEDWLKKR